LLADRLHDVDEKCGCKFCDTNPIDAPRLYVSKKTDGEGSILYSLIAAAAAAASMGWNFGGLIGPMVCDNKADIGTYSDLLAGSRYAVWHSAGNMQEATTTIKNTDIYNKVLENVRGKVSQHAAYLSERKQTYDRVWLSPGDFDPIEVSFTPDYMKHMYATAACTVGARLRHNGLFTSKGHSIAVHIRRADVSATSNSDRFTSDQWFLDILAAVTAITDLYMNATGPPIPAEVHIFSSGTITRSENGVATGTNTTTSPEWDAFRKVWDRALL
jgi:hypothetical protein